jgi:quercetin 2,3-dioxygenase
MKKEIKKIFPRPSNYHMVGDGFRVYNYFPSGLPIRDHVDPFLMLDFNPAYDFGSSATPRGVDVHPHKGFETVTIAYQGAVAHHDSAGNSGVIHPGDVQWMTAGAGILHKEYHEKEFASRGGNFEMVQLWVNLPAKYKLTPPRYQSLVDKEINRVQLSNGGYVKVIAGSCNGVKGSATTFTEINLWDLRIGAGENFKSSIPETHHTSMLVISGKISVNGEEAGQHQFVVFSGKGEELEITGLENSVVLILSGVPIGEPVAQYGPFVMNTQAELQQAFREFQEGKFGVLE